MIGAMPTNATQSIRCVNVIVIPVDTFQASRGELQRESTNLCQMFSLAQALIDGTRFRPVTSLTLTRVPIVSDIFRRFHSHHRRRRRRCRRMIRLS